VIDHYELKRLQYLDKKKNPRNTYWVCSSGAGISCQTKTISMMGDIPGSTFENQRWLQTYQPDGNLKMLFILTPTPALLGSRINVSFKILPTSGF
jgi:hypothetical protein